tara:strand:- start:1028 stop:1465 length:438 start_codon:yes stop_codon:yes gene_type:complete
MYSVGRLGFPEGEWDDEEDHRGWCDEKTGLMCMVKRNYFGTFCGYVRIPYHHPLFRLDYAHDKVSELDPHGGITYAGSVMPGTNQSDEAWWWLGFDCNHSFDLAPAGVGGCRDGMPYRNLEYVTEEVTRLASNLIPSPYEKGKRE